VISPEELSGKAEERERRRLTRQSSSEFFGIQIVSHRVIFVIDVSGSMVEQLRSERIDGRKATRIEVVKREISDCIQELDQPAFFNIVTFNSGVTSWLKRGIVNAGKQSRDEALEYIQRLGSRGGTNIYEAMEAAFADPDVDTIFLLSDGEPTAGSVVDPQSIREVVRRWNISRHIQINTIAVGGTLEVLEWLASDSGGTYVKYH
jgi:Mg-chelatase subunit ChlD